MNIRTNSIVSKNGNSDINLIYGASLPSGIKLDPKGNVNITGISTVGFLTASNANFTGIVTANFFKGDGFQLTNVPSVTSSKSIALRYIIADHPHRS